MMSPSVEVKSVASRGYIHAIIMSVFVFILALRLFVILDYPFIRTADTYGNLAVSDAIIDTGIIPKTSPSRFPVFADTRPNVLPLFGSLLHFVTDIDTFVIYKYVIPLLLVTFFLAFLFVLVRRLAPRHYPIIFPVVSILLLVNPLAYSSVDSFISRSVPQGVALFLFLVILYFLYRYFLEESKGRFVWFVLILAVLALWRATHASYVILFPILPIALLFREWRNLRRVRAIPLIGIFLAAFGIAIYTQWHQISRMLEFFVGVGSFQTIRFSQIRLTLSPLYFAFGALGAFGVMTRRWIDEKERTFYYFTVFSYLLFLSTVTILPYFGLMNFVYTFRFFPFIVIASIPLVVFFFLFLLERKQSITILFLIIGTILLSLTWFSPQKDGGWIIGNEADTIPFLREHTEEDSIFFTQELNGPLLISAGRTAFVTGSRMEHDGHPATENNLRVFYAPSGRHAYEAIDYSFHPDNAMYNTPGISYEAPSTEDARRPRYVLYSKEKATARRDWGKWWIEGSYPDARLRNFEDTRYFMKVWENDSIVLWKVKDIQDSDM